MRTDPIWKKAIHRYIKEFFQFFFPQVAKDIDFNKGVKFLDKELQKITKDSQLGKRLADVLLEVTLKNGDKELIIIHIEVQSQSEGNFAERMFIYNYKIFDRYKKKVVSMAILADQDESFRENKYSFELWNFKLLFEFPYAKLIDYKCREKELYRSRNPFAVLTLAHLKNFESKKDINKLFESKFSIIRSLYDRGFSKEDVLLLYEFIDWMIKLPEDLDRELYRKIEEFEEVKSVRYITTAEKIGMEKGFEKGIEKGIKTGKEKGIKEVLLKQIEKKFGKIDEETKELINKSSIEKLEELAIDIFDIESLDEVKEKLR